MRRQLVSLTLAATAVLATGLSASPAIDETTATSAAPTVAVQRVSLTPTLRDEAAMVLVGTALIGVAAAVRRAA